MLLFVGNISTRNTGKGNYWNSWCLIITQNHLGDEKGRECKESGLEIPLKYLQDYLVNMENGMRIKFGFLFRFYWHWKWFKILNCLYIFIHFIFRFIIVEGKKYN